MIDYAACKRDIPKLKAALTRAKKSKDPDKILTTVAKAYARFDEIGWPDGWHLWEAARKTAETDKLYNRKDTHESQAHR